MTLFALTFILIPLLHVKKTPLVSRKQLHVSLYKDRLQSLDEQFKNSAITLEDYSQSKQELDISLLDDIPEQETEIINHDSSRGLAAILVVILPIAAIFLYWHWGSSQQVTRWLQAKRQAAVVQTEIHQLGSVANIIAALQLRLQQTPNSATGWYLLGKLYFSQQQYQNAVDALAKANQIKPNDPKILLQYAESLFFMNNRTVNPPTKFILQQLLQVSPGNVNAINLLALGAYRSGDYQTAIQNWQQLLPQFPQNSADAKNLLAMIAMAQQKLGHHQAIINLSVSVNLAKNLEQKVAPDETVFIYAKAVSGPPMPLAVVRKQVKDLPITVTLNQNAAMLPSMSLANFKTVKIIARISKSGQAIPQSGDLEGESGVVDTQQHKGIIDIEIDRVVR